MPISHDPPAAPAIPRATYRMQFHGKWTFRQAADLADYLAALGVSHLYASPYFQSGKASAHGYDVADFSRLNPAIGSEDDYAHLTGRLRANGLGQILDFVPNHMGIDEPLNSWWMDVLEHGPASRFAGYFDIEWRPLKPELKDRLLVPTLGDAYGRVLENGEFKLAFEEGAFFLDYYERRFPLNPRSYPLILRDLADDLEVEDREELLSTTGALAALPPRSETDPVDAEARARETRVAKRRLARLAGRSPAVARGIRGALQELEGRKGEPSTFDRLHELMDAQVWRLAHWRVAAEEINYRRFFDVNSLAAIRPEVPVVFKDTHRLVLKLLERGDITGLRIDHIDGLWDPAGYLRKLQESYAALPGRNGSHLYLLVEKILGAHEWLPEEWPVNGTTGYEFAADVGQLLADPAGRPALDALHAELSGAKPFAELVYERKLLVTRISLSSEVAVLGHRLARLAAQDRHRRDFTVRQLTEAVRQVVACFPVYRSYVAAGQTVHQTDRALIEEAVQRARARNPAPEDGGALDFLRAILLLESAVGQPDAVRRAHEEFALKFQQVTGPVMAKGVEDTAFYNDFRLAALNEVGGEPGQFGMTLGEFHARSAERFRRTPHTLLATSTHDTKRAEDTRARMLAISELAGEWTEAVRTWRKLNAGLKRRIHDREAPSPAEESLFYQTLAGAWPFEGITEENRADFISRLQQYLAKALKEGKTNSSWINPDAEWEKATDAFVANALDAGQSGKFLAPFAKFAARIAQLGMVNSLAQVALKCTAPGVPDFYQGCEAWDFSLVDPDNRRPVDYARRRELLRRTNEAGAAELLGEWQTGAVKLFVIRRLLALRAARPAAFERGGHSPLAVSGQHSDRVVAFGRGLNGESPEAGVVVIVPRHTAALGFPPVGESWADTVVQLPAREWEDIFTGARHAGGRAVPLHELLQEFPLAVLR